MSAAETAERDSVYMRRALDLAVKGWGQTAPNPMVGAVVVRDGEIVGEGYHARYGEAHAEVNALNAARGQTRGATIYVTLEPCNHHGKTPPCTNAIIDAGIARVVAAVRDPSLVARGGVERLRNAGIQVDMGVECEAACELNAPFFFAARTPRRPWVTLKLALSADGAVADPTGKHRWITGPESRREVHRMRANSDAILVGIGTVLTDDPELTVRDVPRPRVAPRRVVLDSDLRTPLDSKLVRSAREIDTRVIAKNGLPVRKLRDLNEAGIRVAIHGERNDASLRDTLDILCSADDVRSLLVEAGPRVAGSFLSQSLVDRLVIFRSSLVLGDRAPKAFAFAPQGFEESLQHFRIVERRRFGDDVMTIYALQDVPCSPD